MTYPKAQKAGEIAIGVKQTLRAVECGKAMEVIIANDADAKITREIAEKCKKASVPYSYVDSMKKLGSACGIEVGAAAVAIVNE